MVILAILVIVIGFGLAIANVYRHKDVPTLVTEPVPVPMAQDSALVRVTLTKEGDRTFSSYLTSEAEAYKLIDTLPKGMRIEVGPADEPVPQAQPKAVTVDQTVDLMEVLSDLSEYDLKAGKGPFVAISIGTPHAMIYLMVSRDSAIRVREKITLMGVPDLACEIHPNVTTIQHGLGKAHAI